MHCNEKRNANDRKTKFTSARKSVETANGLIRSENCIFNKKRMGKFRQKGRKGKGNCLMNLFSLWKSSDQVDNGVA